MKKNTAILDTHTKLIKFDFNGTEYTVDLKEGDLHDSWNSIVDTKGITWDFNFTWDHETGAKPYLNIYGVLGEGNNMSTDWDNNTSIKITEIVGNRSFYFDDKDFEFNYRLKPTYEVFNGKDESVLKTKSLNRASDETVNLKTFKQDPNGYVIATDLEGAIRNLSSK